MKLLTNGGERLESVPRSHAPPEGIRVEETVEPFNDDLPVVEDDVA